MKIGMVGLGRMGGNMTERLLEGGHQVVAYARSAESVREAVGRGAIGAGSLEELVGKLEAPRVVWLMIPVGRPVEETIRELRSRLAPGDVVVDGGNSRFSDSERRARELAADGIGFLDSGTSGGVWGLKEGYCLMIGGEARDFDRVEPVFRTLAPPEGYAHIGPAGAGHYVKMVHNAIEYAMLQSYGEGFELLQVSEYGLDLRRIAELWTRGAVVRSWLLDLLVLALREDPKLASIEGYVEDSGMGRWTIHEAVDRGVPVPVMADSLFARFVSRQTDSFSAKVIAALRNQFGGHAVKSR
ncbi:MAG: phosphogluconate dehydrogenase (NAD(+)-dependent, decarboxylating) [Thermoanaerobaculia bacterium]